MLNLLLPKGCSHFLDSPLASKSEPLKWHLGGHHRAFWFILILTLLCKMKMFTSLSPNKKPKNKYHRLVAITKPREEHTEPRVTLLLGPLSASTCPSSFTSNTSILSVHFAYFPFMPVYLRSQLRVTLFLRIKNSFK